jgi:rootletin
MSTQAASQNGAFRKTETGNLLNIHSNLREKKIYEAHYTLELLQLQQAFDSLKMELENSVEHIENLTLQNQTASDERDHLTVLSSSQKETIEILVAQISDLKVSIIKDADDKFSQLMGQLEQERATVSEVKTALCAAETNNHSLTNDCQKLSQLCADNNETIRSLQTVIQDLRVQLKSKDNAIEDTQQNLDDKMREIVSLVNAVDSLKSELSSVKEEKKTLVVSRYKY